MVGASKKCHTNSHHFMKVCLKLTDFICEYLKVDCIESDLEAEEIARKRLQNADTKSTENPILNNNQLVTDD